MPKQTKEGKRYENPARITFWGGRPPADDYG